MSWDKCPCVERLSVQSFSDRPMVITHRQLAQINDLFTRNRPVGRDNQLDSLRCRRCGSSHLLTMDSISDV